MEFINTKLKQKHEVIKVIGLGGAGSNAVNHMAKKYPSDVIHICANTDIKHLESLEVEHKINLGSQNTTRGLGAGMRSHAGKEAAKESLDEIKNAISGADMLFIAAGMGGGTGTGSAPVVAEIAKDMGILTVAVVTKPFSGEGKKKKRIANEGIGQLIHQVDSLIILPNDRLADTLSKEILSDMEKTLASSDDVLANSVHAVTDIITKTGRMNIDFADIRTVMSLPGKAMISSGIARGDDRASKAVKLALSNPLIETMVLNDAKGILVNISGNSIGHTEYGDVNNLMEEYAHDDADVKLGFVEDSSLGDSIKITIILTGLEPEENSEYSPHLSLETNNHSILDDSTSVPIVSSQVHNTITAATSIDMANNQQIPAYLRTKQQA